MEGRVISSTDGRSPVGLGSAQFRERNAHLGRILVRLAVDLCENDHLIPYTLTPCVQARIGITGKQLWAEPDLEVAALSMRNAFGHYPNNGWRERDGKFHGFEKVYGYQAIGEEFIEVLRGL